MLCLFALIKSKPWNKFRLLWIKIVNKNQPKVCCKHGIKLYLQTTFKKITKQPITKKSRTEQKKTWTKYYHEIVNKIKNTILLKLKKVIKKTDRVCVNKNCVFGGQSYLKQTNKILKKKYKVYI